MNLKTAWLCIGRDHEGSAALREATLQDHFRYIETIMERLLVAGPLAGDDDGIHGSCLVYDVETREEALALLHNDPYHQAGVWTDIECRRITLAAGRWIGGAAWQQEPETPE